MLVQLVRLRLSGTSLVVIVNEGVISGYFKGRKGKKKYGNDYTRAPLYLFRRVSHKRHETKMLRNTLGGSRQGGPSCTMLSISCLETPEGENTYIS